MAGCDFISNYKDIFQELTHDIHFTRSVKC